jgi:hypothetical protein
MIRLSHHTLLNLHFIVNKNGTAIGSYRHCIRFYMISNLRFETPEVKVATPQATVGILLSGVLL